jgi:two-component system, NtrC family, sensor histidine kinase HydH
MERNPPLIAKLDVLWLLFLAGLAVLPPILEIQKQLFLLAFGVLQLLETRLMLWQPVYGPILSVLLKISLATLLLDHTGVIGINSSYYPVYYLPIATAALYFGPVVTLLWTVLASLAYCSYLIPALRDYELTASGASELAIRILFFFLAAILVNRFATDNRTQTQRYRQLSETLAEANRQLQRAEAEARRTERLAALGQLSAGLAHEIRNPLGVIKGSAEMLRQKVQGSQPLLGELAGYIASEVDRASALVSRFLDFARPSRLELRLEPITGIIDRAVESVSSRYPAAAVAVHRDYAADLPLVEVDRQLCEQLFINLIQNAYEAILGNGAGSGNGRGGTVSISVAAEESPERPGVVVSVDDDGPGVPAEMQREIFNPFFTSRKEGVGLGLSIAAKIVDDHRGWIRLQSQPSHGAHFCVFLPLKPEA